MRRIRLSSWAVAFGLLLSACGQQAPAPVEFGPREGVVQRPGARTAAATTPSSPARADEGGEEITVQRGDTVYGLARRHNQPVRPFIEANDLRPPYILQPGQRLRLVGGRQHVVQPGETLYTISRLYGVDTYALARSNNLAPPFNLTNGQALRIPTGQPVPPVIAAPLREAAPQSASAVATAPATSSAAGVTIEALPAPGAAQPVTGAANPPPTSSPRVTGQPVASAPLPPPAPTTLQTPARPQNTSPTTAPTAAEPPAAPSAPIVQETASAPSAPSPATPPASSAAPPAAVPAAAPPAAPEARETPEDRTPMAEPPPRSGRTFAWPVRGRILSTFGPKPDGLHNDGINIAARAGSPVIAAENGVVVYAGSELKGFGNLLLVRHADGWITAYAHLERALVKKGQSVKKGQAIGTVGSSGGVDQPQLHFEIRRGTQAVDPAKFLTIALLEHEAIRGFG